jgi:hypothetical protein
MTTTTPLYVVLLTFLRFRYEAIAAVLPSICELPNNRYRQHSVVLHAAQDNVYVTYCGYCSMSALSCCPVLCAVIYLSVSTMAVLQASVKSLHAPHQCGEQLDSTVH